MKKSTLPVLHTWRCGLFLLWLGVFVADTPRLLAAYCDLVCYSLQFQTGEAPSGSLEFTASDGQPNGELFPEGSSVPQSHGAYFAISYRPPGGMMGYGASGRLAVDIPDVDTDANGAPDVLDVDLALPETITSGTAVVGSYNPGTVSAIWRRSAGSRTGECSLTISGMRMFGATVYETYTFSFEVFAYRGPLPYLAEGNTVTAQASLRKLDALDSRLVGTFDFTRTDTLSLAASGLLIDETATSLPFVVLDDFGWDGRSYWTILVFLDYLTSTSVRDYSFWVLTITVPSDSDADGIPDLADVDWQGSFTVPPPHLTLSRPEVVLRVSVSGTPGQAVRLEHTSSLLNPAWDPLQTVLLGTAPAMWDLGPAVSSSGFWRVATD